LRRAALGVIRIILENDLRLPLLPAIQKHYTERLTRPTATLSPTEVLVRGVDSHALGLDLLSFFADRLKVYMRDQGARHDLIDAVFALGSQDDLALIVKRVTALGEFLKTDDGANLLAGVKRAANILGLEEKKDKSSYEGAYDLKLLKEPEELALAAAIESVKQDTTAAINVENFAGAMRALAELRKPVDAFFEKVTVNDKDADIRRNRLKLLSEIRSATLQVADFSKIAG
jgi:glycyl-tRNA synthetase beta chain